jgi:hypothetical protein
MHREVYEMEKSEKAGKGNAAKKDPANPDSRRRAHCLYAAGVAEVALPFAGRRPVLGFALQ